MRRQDCPANAAPEQRKRLRFYPNRGQDRSIDRGPSLRDPVEQRFARFRQTYTPGPWCPTNIADGAEAGGNWFLSGETGNESWRFKTRE
ncbi:hypothetical protein ANTHELSMS3_04884 (plasmid) [Antarctobacter heliothermus]|uniref:Uncharacterized protein n=1 Tax=Antarctobacter heliothermus TaxID=74033 RepID=A0A222EAQ5_9RHOB|nr:hypothetical protein [Antarctobacter heliothermus]ASP23274.1 hypothetical protein ANTHELSMS3_04884 [Antarctobacter heliothermus]